MSKQTKFDREDVIDKATNLYWEKGFHGTSMRNLQEVVDLRPGSIYASFGSKENLFKEALNHYADLSGSQLKKYLAETNSPLGALKIFITNIVVNSQDTAPSGMCMLVKTIAELTDEHQELVDIAKEKLAGVEKAFTRIIEQAVEQGELDSSCQPDKIARHLQVQIIGLRTYIRANKDKQIGKEMIDELFSNLPLNSAKKT
ncbi:TetR/AcrR family transcriptional regulator [Vibrio sp. TH_r3]|uniref:TetR/AcrR family transcriptional regulator n=1 Tax=Vibrio sp. TH_r3 TaxID=3082084 RepID=UPI0029537AC9|nr:TetR/AcrR family transcriptional regulator [Vibrio sp. TH_r3]MDV7103722.1 TetR/AcrR family transcriptional regulator [Vibrio sp. TH_r3]